jgi:hypothetical protein
VPSSFSPQPPVDAYKQPAFPQIKKKAQFSSKKEYPKVVSQLATTLEDKNELASFSILIQNFFTSFEILRATFRILCSSSCKEKSSYTKNSLNSLFT